LEPLKDVVGCVTSEGFVTRYSRRSGDQQTASFQDEFAILNRRNGQVLKLELAHRYTVTEGDYERGPWKVSTVEYIYEVADESDEPIARFHWHSVSAQPGDEVRWPHVHVHGDRAALTLHKLHLPTGRVSIESVVRFLIDDFDVVPVRANWDAILREREEAFKRWRSWH
jgi:hypothetical protein